METMEEQSGPEPTDPVGVIGTGAIGTAVARTYLGAGHRVVVWNRTADRAADVIRAGAVPAASPSEVVRVCP
jgi:3-hydroxyisobutyrate dehydrogenase-like beta-hydroxyacid dehydrogenase